MPSGLPDLAALLPSWQLSMRAERKSPATVTSYTEPYSSDPSSSSCNGLHDFAARTDSRQQSPSTARMQLGCQP
jgi:hypothetical protein